MVFKSAFQGFGQALKPASSALIRGRTDTVPLDPSAARRVGFLHG